MLHHIVWHNIPVQIDYNPNYSNAYLEVYGYSLAHIKVSTEDGRALPITETGFKSQFIAEPNVAAYGSVTAYVTAWLEEAAQDPKWHKVAAEQNQLRLF